MFDVGPCPHKHDTLDVQQFFRMAEEPTVSQQGLPSSPRSHLSTENQTHETNSVVMPPCAICAIFAYCKPCKSQVEGLWFSLKATSYVCLDVRVRKRKQHFKDMVGLSCSPVSMGRRLKPWVYQVSNKHVNFSMNHFEEYSSSQQHCNNSHVHGIGSEGGAIRVSTLLTGTNHRLRLLH